MRNNFLFFIDQDGGSSDIFSADLLMPHGSKSHLLSHIASFVDSSRYLYLHGNAVLQEAFNCMSKFSGALVLWFATGSNTNNSKPHGDQLGSNSSYSKARTHVKHISAVRRELTGFWWKVRSRRQPSIFRKISSFTLNQLHRETERVQSFPLISLAAMLIPPFTNVATNGIETSCMETQTCIDQKLCEIENGGCGPFDNLYFQSLDFSENAVEPRTGIEFPTMLDSRNDGERDSNFNPEALLEPDTRIMTIIRIKSLNIYAFGFYVHPFDICEKLGPKYACIPEYELNKCRDFYQDLLREDINMTVRLVVSCNGIKINAVKDAFEKSLRARLAKTNPNADLSCLDAFGSLFSQHIPLDMGTIIDFKRTADGHIITEIGGNHIGAVQSKDLCRAFFDMYIGDIPVCEQTKEKIGKNVASLMRKC
ncbi:fatty-acid-binding protein 2-like [Dorcoceras hygrometricum]|uniref:Fatty-acid-binding protein 2-like n=1 Tax=Dorcoceras hygrometricum TaxID=472368 RepID=A0A2Z7BS80_9LAMI|nr:fatty-acid-binding protein 2-like [Dorcoceras hygrometricum]